MNQKQKRKRMIAAGRLSTLLGTLPAAAKRNKPRPHVRRANRQAVDDAALRRIRAALKEVRQ